MARSRENTRGGSSPHFDGVIGEVVAPDLFPPANYVIDRERYDYEGNWAFCLFNNDECAAARFGFGLGRFDASDYGGSKPEKPMATSLLYLPRRWSCTRGTR